MKKQVGIIGAGVVGLCVAIKVQQQGHNVTLIDRQAAGLGASYGNAGYLATELVDPLATRKTLKQAPRLWLNRFGPLSIVWRYLHRAIPWYVKFALNATAKKEALARDALFSLNSRAIPAWQALLDDIDASDLLINSGYLLVWETDKGREDAKSLQKYYRQWGIETEFLERELVLALEPALTKNVIGALWFPNAHQVVSPFTLCQRLHRCFLERGSIFIQDEVLDLNPYSDGVVSVRLTENVESFDALVICAGAWSKPLLGRLGIQVPLEAERGYHLTIEEAQAPRISHVIGSVDRHTVLTPLGQQIRIVGISEIGGFQRPAKPSNFRSLNHHMSALLPQSRSALVKAQEWMGYRPTLPDSLPVISRHPQFENILMSFGHQHLGLTQAAVSAQCVVDLLENTAPAFSLAPFDVSRFISK